MMEAGPAGGGRASLVSAAPSAGHIMDRTSSAGPLIDRTNSCDQEYQQLTGSTKQHHSKPFSHTHLPPAHQHLQWKSAEDIFLSSTGGTILSQPPECDGGGVGGEVGDNPHRLVSSVSAYPLPNTNSSGAITINPCSTTVVTASSVTINSTSSSSTINTTSSSHNSQQTLQSSNSTCVTASSNNPSEYMTSQTQQGQDILHSSSLPISSTPSGDSSSHQSSGVSPLDLSAIPPVTHVTLPTPTENGEGRFSQSPAPSPKPSPTSMMREMSCDSSDDRTNKYDNSCAISREGSMERSFAEASTDLGDKLPDSTSRLSESGRSGEGPRTPEISGSVNGLTTKERKESRDSKSSDKKSNKAWYKMLNPTYKSRSEDLKRLFKDLPSDERLIVDYSCALQKDILVHGRLYVTPNYFCFYSKIFGWETFVSIKSKDIVAMTKEKTALVIPNAVEIRTDGEKHFFTSFASRDKTYLMLFRIWQNALMDQQMSATELWQWVHSSYGDELGLTSDDDDYVAPSTEDDVKTTTSSTPLPAAYSHSLPLAPPAPKLHSVDSTEDTCPGDSSIDVCSSTLSKSDVIDEVCEVVGSEMCQPDHPTSPTRSPRHHINSSPQPNDTLPTDFSDTTESEPDSKVTCLGTGESVACPNLSSHHQGREIINIVFALPVDTVFTLLFTNSKFMLDLYTARKTTDVVASPWQSNAETNQKLRQVTYTLTLPPNSFGPKVSHVTETQVVSPFSKHGDIYTVDAEACNAGIPYADSFFVSNHWCLTRESANETRLSVWSQVKYKKNVWGFMKGVIDKNSYSGVESLLNDINVALQAEVDRTSKRTRRRRRGRVGSKGEPPDVLKPQVYPDKVKDTHKSTQIPARKLTLPTITPDNIGASNEGPVRLVVATLIILLTLNALLYYKLWALEEKMFHRSSPYPTIDPSMFRSGVGSGPLEEWVRILQQQEALHAAEVERWRKSIEEAAGFLKRAEESLRSLHTSIPPHQASKIQLLLRQIQSLHEAEAQRRTVQDSNLDRQSEKNAKRPSEDPSSSEFPNKPLDSSVYQEL